MRALKVSLCLVGGSAICLYAATVVRVIIRLLEVLEVLGV